MKKINKIDDLDEILNKRFDLKYFSTSMKSRSDYEEKLGYLYLIEEKENYLIICKRNGFYIADGFLSKDIPTKIDFNEDLILEYTFKRFDKEGVELLNSLGFIEKAKRTQMELKIEGNYSDEIEFLDESNLDLVIEEIVRSFDKYYGCIPTREELNRSFKNGEILGIVEGNNLKGFIEFKKSSKKSLVINHIAVLKEYRRQGIGKKLIEKLCSYAHKMGYNRIELFVNEDNEEAFTFYKSLGFVEKNIKSIIYRR